MTEADFLREFPRVRFHCGYSLSADAYEVGVLWARREFIGIGEGERVYARHFALRFHHRTAQGAWRGIKRIFSVSK